jgi:hypothetical protein
VKQLQQGSQAQLILAHMARGRNITPLSALRMFDCLRLGARIWELKRRGWKIKREMLDLANGKTIASYFLASAR